VAEVVADASALIALDQIGQLWLLKKVFGQVVIPSAVAREVERGQQLAAWVQVRMLRGPLDERVAAASLDRGESEAISLALEAKATHLILDDLPARRLATGLGIPVVGTAGVVYLAKARGLVPAMRPVLDALRAKGFRLRQDVYEQLLENAGET
jgi:predicted nucleic acid-binding protein